MYKTDWHIHTEASYDASMKIEELLTKAYEMGLEMFGITDHANYNLPSDWEDIKKSKEIYENNKKEGFYFGIELTVIPKAMYQHVKKYATREGYESVEPIKNYEMELMLTKQDIEGFGMHYVIAAPHSPWHTDTKDSKWLMSEWHRQHMYIATDERVDILGHPWYYNKVNPANWILDFNLIPKSMHDELAAALIENDIAMEASQSLICGEGRPQDFYEKYNEYLRYMFEKGVRMTFGSDSHGPIYPDHREAVAKALGKVGFKEGDFTIPNFRSYD